MRIIVWNCAMSLHTKWDRLMGLRPDVAVIAECADPGILWSRRKSAPECDAQWIGDNPHKGLGVFAFPGFSLKRDQCYDARFKQFLPVNVSGEANFSLLAIWAFNRRTKPATTSYGAATMAAIDHYQGFLSAKRSVVAGDFNHSTKWDHERKAGNFTTIVSHLEGLGLASAYHKLTNVPFGAEPDATLFFRKGPLEYHIDYCFLPREWTARNVVVGSREQWIGISDHAPLVVDCTADRDAAVKHPLAGDAPQTARP